MAHGMYIAVLYNPLIVVKMTSAELTFARREVAREVQGAFRIVNVMCAGPYLPESACFRLVS
jgi:hypothetical protein